MKSAKTLLISALAFGWCVGMPAMASAEVTNPDFPASTMVVYNTDNAWSINTFCCEEPTGEGAGNGVMSALIDNDVNHFCHSHWSNGVEYKGHHYFVLDLGAETEFFGLHYVPRVAAGNNNGSWYEFSAWMSNDAADFADVPTHDEAAMAAYFESHPADETHTVSVLARGSDGTGETIKFDKGYKARYILIVPKGYGIIDNAAQDPSKTPTWNCGAELGLVVADPNASAIADAQKALDAAKDIAGHYKLTAPMAADEIDKILEDLKEITGEVIYSLMGEGYDAYIREAIIVPVERAVVSSVAEACKEGTIAIHVDYPEFPKGAWVGYLSSRLRDPGMSKRTGQGTPKGYVDFDYTTTLDATCAWTLEPAETEGQFRFKSADGLYIATPLTNYCHVAEASEDAGLFTIGAREGYVTFPSVAHEGCGLSFDCENDPVEIFAITSPQSWWYVEAYTAPAPVVLTVTPAADEKVAKLESVTITVEGATSLVANQSAALATWTSNDQVVADADGVTLNSAIEGTVCTWPVDFTQDGTYTLSIPAAMFTTDGGAVNAAFTATWTVDATVGISEVTVAPAESATLYDLQGRRVVKPTTGLYILDGKKIFIKK